MLRVTNAAPGARLPWSAAEGHYLILDETEVYSGFSDCRSQGGGVAESLRALTLRQSATHFFVCAGLNGGHNSKLGAFTALKQHLQEFFAALFLVDDYQRFLSPHIIFWHISYCRDSLMVILRVNIR